MRRPEARGRRDRLRQVGDRDRGQEGEPDPLALQQRDADHDRLGDPVEDRAEEDPQRVVLLSPVGALAVPQPGLRGGSHSSRRRTPRRRAPGRRSRRGSPAASKADAVRSSVTAEMRAPAPNPATRPIARRGHGRGDRQERRRGAASTPRRGPRTPPPARVGPPRHRAPDDRAAEGARAVSMPRPPVPSRDARALRRPDGAPAPARASSPASSCSAPGSPSWRRPASASGRGRRSTRGSPTGPGSPLGTVSILVGHPGPGPVVAPRGAAGHRDDPQHRADRDGDEPRAAAPPRARRSRSRSWR